MNYLINVSSFESQIEFNSELLNFWSKSDFKGWYARGQSMESFSLSTHWQFI